MIDRLRNSAPAVGLFFGGLIVWEAGVRLFNIKAFLLPAPSAIARAFVAEWDQLVDVGFGTFSTAIAGLAVGTGTAVLASFAAARWQVVREGTMPVAIAANSTPIIVLAPVANSWFGLRSADRKSVV